MKIEVKDGGLVQLGLNQEERAQVTRFLSQTDFPWACDPEGDQAGLKSFAAEKYHVTLCPWHEFKKFYKMDSVMASRRESVDGVRKLLDTVTIDVPMLRLGEISTAVRGDDPETQKVSVFIALRDQDVLYRAYLQVRSAVLGLLLGHHADPTLLAPIPHALRQDEVLFHVSVSSLSGEPTDAVGGVKPSDMPTPGGRFAPQNGSNIIVPPNFDRAS
jgi:hypothetical protein